MNFMGLALRMCDNSRNAYSPYAFYPGNKFTDQEKEAIKTIILRHNPERVDAMFNNWIFGKIDEGFYTAKRVTWNRQYSGKNIYELLCQIENYYEK